jgi:3'(2'), 5'-bisphosphate nucleotidase
MLDAVARPLAAGNSGALSELNPTAQREEPYVPTLDAPACAALLEAVTALAARAALVIRDCAGKDGPRSKADGSPVTAADIASEAAIHSGLSAIAPALPIVSEEQTQGSARPAAGESYFLVDPLDGTREFIAGRDEYAVNIALLTRGAPLLGVIAAPALGLIWRGLAGGGAERLAFAADGKMSPPERIHARVRPQHAPVVLVSRSHLDARTQAYLRTLQEPRTIACGSAIKFCRIAEGSADLYPRLAPTHDWDVAAGHAVMQAAGGSVVAADGTPLRYGTPELLIPGFVAAGKANDA